MVYSRDAIQWQVDHTEPIRDAKEWIDEPTGSVIKWPVPVLSATPLEWLPEVASDLFIIQTPSHLSSNERQYIADRIRSGMPVAIFGSPAGGVDPELAKLSWNR